MNFFNSELSRRTGGDSLATRRKADSDELNFVVYVPVDVLEPRQAHALAVAD
jgi:hypothetical protein